MLIARISRERRWPPSCSRFWRAVIDGPRETGGARQKGGHKGAEPATARGSLLGEQSTRGADGKQGRDAGKQRESRRVIVAACASASSKTGWTASRATRCSDRCLFPLPRRDTNEIAHVLLRRYRSYSAVLEADPLDRARTEGVGETAAMLLSLVPAPTRRYAVDRAGQERHALTTRERAAELLDPFMAGGTEERCCGRCCGRTRAIRRARFPQGGGGRVQQNEEW